MVDILLFLIFCAVFVSFLFFIKTKDTAQKVVALDIMSICMVSLLTLLSVTYKSSFYIDIAFVFALVGFVGVIVFARFNKYKNRLEENQKGSSDA
ncbi:MAG: monovalent cation/H+ antiporter complex subunit F [Campylobacterota bacterium]|nr:monovalent cation/H+ antiporter complex subunit F [Campylobacterota bacterium]